MNSRATWMGRLALFVLMIGVLAGSARAGELSPPDPAPLQDWMHSYFEDCLNDPGDYSCLETFWTPEKVEAVERSERVRRSAFPDLKYEVLDVLVDGGLVAVRCRVTGRAADAADGDPGQLELQEGFFYELADGKIQRGKLISDRMAVAEALGYTVASPNGS